MDHVHSIIAEHQLLVPKMPHITAMIILVKRIHLTVQPYPIAQFHLLYFVQMDSVKVTEANVLDLILAL